MALRFEVDEDGFLKVRQSYWIPGTTATAALHFEPEGVRVSTPVRSGRNADARPLLAWNDFAGPKPRIRRDRPTGWVFRESFAARHGGDVGVAVHVKGQCATDCAAIVNAVVSPWRTFKMRTAAAGRRFPVTFPTGTDIGRESHSERDTLGALASVLRGRPDLRERLGQRDRVWQLAFDLSDTLQFRRGVRRNYSTREMTVIRALRRAGFRHRFGRPLMAGEVRPLDEVMERTLEDLQQQHGPTASVCQPSFVEAVARVSYLDIEPWPFEALVR